MASTPDPRATLAELHRYTIGEVLGLVEGLYLNIEDGLFELADRDSEVARQERCFNLMRELRFRRACLTRNFTGSLQSLTRYWFVDESWAVEPKAFGDELAVRMLEVTNKSDQHFTGLLRLITERACHATNLDSKALNELPIGPWAISQAFVQSCRSLCMDTESIEMVLRLFSRFVLERLGQIYANCNIRLRDAGFLTLDELHVVGKASA